MRILIEEYGYDISNQPNKELVALLQKVLYGIGVDKTQTIEGKLSISYVGYFYNPDIQDCVFILPKVVIDGQDNVLGDSNISPWDLLDKGLTALKDEQRKFIYEFAVWIYRALVVYKEHNDQSIIIEPKEVSQISHTRRRRTNTMLDVLLSLIQFAKDHQDFITFTLRNIHSGYNKINWTRTINRSQAIIQDGCPIYLNPVNKKRQVNFDEELLIIFYSILNYIKEKYGFKVNINVNFQLIKGAQFESYINGRGVIRLRQIKYKYFSDIALELWELCNAFFDRSQNIYSACELKEFLLAKNFYIVFEAMIDELLGSNKEKEELEKKLYDQRDGKIVDHLYTYTGLMEVDGKYADTYYIGDSKYYKIGAALGDTSIYKQYTYARNVIQYNIDLWLDSSKPNPDIKVRDDQTEGYNILPNFFISANMKERDFSYSHRDIELLESTKKEPNPRISYQFPDRLFDRDTLLLSRYNVNFLFVTALYARNNASEKATWRKEARDKFREEIQRVLEKDYKFYPMRSKGVNPNEYVQKHFKQLIGKVFTPFEDKEIITLALDQDYSREAEHKQLLEQLRADFYIQEDYHIGKHPDLPPRAAIVCNSNDIVLVGYYTNFEHLQWIHNEKMYNVRLGDAKGSMDITPQLLSAKYVLLHGKHGISLCKLAGEGPKIKSKEDLVNNHEYPSTVTSQGTQYYFVFKIKGRGIKRDMLEKHGFDINLLWEKLGIDPTKGQQGNLTLRPHTVTLPQVLDCLATPMTKEEVE